MTIPFIQSPGGLFNRFGRIGALIRTLNTEAFQLSIPFANIEAQYIGGALVNPEPDLIGPLQQQLAPAQAGLGSTVTSTLSTLAKNTVLRMVYEDHPLSSNTDIGLATNELIRQMRLNNQSVMQSNVVLTILPALSIEGNLPTGNGVVVGSTRNGLGLVQENAFQETAFLVCTADSQTGGATAGNEQFRFTGQQAQANALAWDWGNSAGGVLWGSGATAQLTCVNAGQNNASGNLLTNGSFEAFTSNAPNNWTIINGTAGTNILKGSTANSYAGLASLQVVGDGLTNTALTQQFNLPATGTGARLQPETVYAFNFWAKMDSVPGAGVLAVELVDQNGAVTVSDQNVPNASLVPLTTAATTYTAYNGTFITPRVMPANTFLRLRLSTPLSAGKNLFIDHLAMATMTRLYAGGVYLTMFSGSVPFILGDTFSVITTNSRGGQTANATMQSLFDRLIGMRALGLLLPSSPTPTITDSLIL